MKKIFASAVLVAAMCCPCAAEEARYTKEDLLSEYRSIIREIERERDALADERAWMEEERSRKEVDDVLYGEMARIIDKRAAAVDALAARLERERALLEAERARAAERERTPVRAYSIKDPLIKRDLDIKIHRYWWLD